MGASAQKELMRNHSPSKQFIHLIGKILLRWLVSLTLAAMMVVAFYEFEKLHILNTKAKRWFNALSTGLYLTLGLNLAASLKGMAILVRWKLLARKRHQLQEIDFILGLSSLIKVSRYGFYIAGTRPLTALACFSWILFNAVSASYAIASLILLTTIQVGRLSVAGTGATYSYDSANATGLVPGIVNVTDWTTPFGYDPTSPSRTLNLESARYAAHTYGFFSMILEEQPLTPAGKSDPNRPLDSPIESAPDGSWAYYFREYNPTLSSHGPLAHKSNRWVNVSSSCDFFPVIEGQYGNTSSVTYRNGTQERTFRGLSDLGPSATTWINPRPDAAANANVSCGPRCAPVYALIFLSKDSPPQTGSLYACNVTVSDVRNATKPAHELPDSIASMAAGSIGLSGFSDSSNSWEYARFPTESFWADAEASSTSPDPQHIAQLAARFAVGTIAVKDIYGIHDLEVQGIAAWVGVLIKVKWKYLLLILALILASQLLLGLAAVLYANTVFCKDESYLSTARLLRPVVERLGPSGCAMTGRDIAHTLREFMVYGVRKEGSQLHLDLGEDIPEMKRFPRGWYDGYVEWEDVDGTAAAAAAAAAEAGTEESRWSSAVSRRTRRSIPRIRRRRAFSKK